jgi:predicted TIM-barrel fold metal-dependent hydrolase
MYDLFARTWDTPDQLGPELAKRFALSCADPTCRPDASPAGLDQSARDTAATIVHGLRIARLGAHIPTRTVARAVTLNPGKLVGFAGIDVSLDAWQDDLKAALDVGIKGVTISPCAQHVGLTDPRQSRLFEACEKHGLPVMIENGFVKLPQSDMRLVDPQDLDQAAKTFPSVKFISSEAGFPWTEQTMLVALRRENVFLELACHAKPALLTENLLTTALSLGVDSRLLLSSGYPFATAQESARAILFAGWPPTEHKQFSVPRAIREAIVSRDILTVLGVEKPAATGDENGSRKIVEKTIV